MSYTAYVSQFPASQAHANINKANAYKGYTLGLQRVCDGTINLNVLRMKLTCLVAVLLKLRLRVSLSLYDCMVLI